MNKETILILIAGLILFAGGLFKLNQDNKKASPKEKITINNIDLESEERKTMPASLSANKKIRAPEMKLDQEKTYLANLETSEGSILIQLNAKDTPITVNNFIYLAKENFYDNTIFHRAINGFMIQGGDPRGDGTGSPGYKFADEKFEGEYKRGTLAMANSGPNSNGSQFFIMHQDYQLPLNYVIFGQVIEGIEVVDSIATAKVEMSFSGEMSRPINPVVIKSIQIEEK